MVKGGYYISQNTKHSQPLFTGIVNKARAKQSKHGWIMTILIPFSDFESHNYQLFHCLPALCPASGI